MGDRDRQPHQLQVHSQHQYGGVGKNFGQQAQQGPSASTVIAVLTLLPVGGTLLALAGLTLLGTIIGLAVAFPLFVICSPVLVPAAITIGLAVAAFLTTGAFGITGLSSLSYVANYVRQVTASVPEQLDQAKRQMLDLAAQTGQKTKEVGHEIQQKAQEAKSRS
ncbi:hypothetical protein UlMin_022370 [Ulmus minor]